MKLLKICVNGLYLFKEKLEFDFTSNYDSSNYDDDGLHNIFSNIYTNNVISIIGINASGKSTLLNVLSFSMDLLNGVPINTNTHKKILESTKKDQNIVLENYFYLDSHIYYLNTSIRSINGYYYIDSEVLKHREANDIQSKENLFDFSSGVVDFVRNGDELFLSKDISIVVALSNKYSPNVNYINMIQYVDTNVMLVSENVPEQILKFLDPTIEHLNISITNNGLTNILLKFNGEQELSLNDINKLNDYLSSGTIKGINLYFYAAKMFNCGGYMIIDEIENHLNREIVATIIRFFLNKKINTVGATLLYSTHTAELLDEFDRNDSIYILKNKEGITVQNLSKLLAEEVDDKCNIYLSNFLGGTSPEYEHFINLKRSLIQEQEGD